MTKNELAFKYIEAQSQLNSLDKMYKLLSSNYSEMVTQNKKLIDKNQKLNNELYNLKITVIEVQSKLKRFYKDYKKQLTTEAIDTIASNLSI